MLPRYHALAASSLAILLAVGGPSRADSLSLRSAEIAAQAYRMQLERDFANRAAWERLSPRQKELWTAMTQVYRQRNYAPLEPSAQNIQAMVWTIGADPDDPADMDFV